jgi:Subunit 11 of the general transcription factor TFIIH
LPHPRRHSLKSGGTKESNLIRFVDQEIYKIQRRYANRNTKELGIEGEGAAHGYESFVEVEKDMERLVDLIWISGTRE